MLKILLTLVNLGVLRIVHVGGRWVFLNFYMALLGTVNIIDHNSWLVETWQELSGRAFYYIVMSNLRQTVL